MHMAEIDYTVSPSYCIQDPETCTDKTAVEIMRAVNDHASRMVESEEFNAHYSELPVNVRMDINNGHCDDICIFVRETVKQLDCDDERVQIVNLVQVPYSTDSQRHSWIVYYADDGSVYHFDAECPWGITPWYYLPAIRRQPWLLDQNMKFHYTDPREDPRNAVRGIWGMRGTLNENGYDWFTPE